ncbi:hypothetical protein MRB53_039590 [Persea americana]|nr:hypothetical protein MRB53_039590 [Persea americana]
MDSVITDIEEQLRSDGMNLTFEILAAAKRMGVNATMILQDTGLRQTKDKVKSYSLLMRDFPLDDLLSATTLDKAADAVIQIFGHLNRRIRSVPYPIARAIPLVEAITEDIDAQVQSSKPTMMRVKDFITTSRDVLRKRNEKFLVMRINARHIKTQERLSYLSRFRKAHEQLRTSVISILNMVSKEKDTRWRAAQLREVDAATEMNIAYHAFG